MDRSRSSCSREAASVSGRIIIREEAEADISEAAIWYQLQRAGLGKEFFAEVRALQQFLVPPILAQTIRIANTLEVVPVPIKQLVVDADMTPPIIFPFANPTTTA